MVDTSKLAMGDVIKTYITLREKKEAIAAAQKDALADIHAKMAKIEAWIQTQADETGVTSFKTDHGTAFMNTSDFASVGDWDEVLAWVKDHDAWDMLTKGVSKAAVRSYIDVDKAVPNGVNFGTKVGVSVRRPTTKV
jgi:hypothetical protein